MDRDGVDVSETSGRPCDGARRGAVAASPRGAVESLTEARLDELWMRVAAEAMGAHSEMMR